MIIRVECYGGHRGEETPRHCFFDDRAIAVAEVLDCWLGQDHRYFKVRGSDGGTYILRHDERAQGWELTLFERKQAPRRGE